MLLDWLVGTGLPVPAAVRPSETASIEVPKWRILPDRFGAEANSPVMDNIGGGPLGISELLVRATTVPTYLKDDWFRDWGALQRLNALLPRRPAGPPGSRHGDAQRAVEPGAAAADIAIQCRIAEAPAGRRN